MNNEPRLTAILLSACPPDDAQQRRLEEVLTKKYGKPVSLTWQEDKTAAGGFLVIDKIVLCRPAGTGELSLFVQQLRRCAVFFHVRPP